MADSNRPAVFISGLAAGTFSTFQREVQNRRIFSSRFTPEANLCLEPTSGRLVTVTSEPTQITVEQILQFVLDSLSFPRNVFCVPGGPAAAARGTVEIRTEAPVRVVARVTGLGQLPPGTVLTVWLLHDLTVPTTLDQADLATIQRLAPGANLPGTVFTVDGQLPTVGRADVPVWNTVAVAVRAGTLTVQVDGSATLEVTLSDDVNQAIDPRVLMGTGVVPATATMPSGMVAGVLTDTFMRQATVLPQLSVSQAFPQRLAAVTQLTVQTFDRGGDGLISAEDVREVAGAFLSPTQFSRVAITIEPVVRVTPATLPTEQGVVLVGLRSTSC